MPGDPEYISEYIIYRSTTPFFTPGPADSIASTTATTWTDTLAVGDTSNQYVYTVIAVDDFGNRSAVGGYAGEYDNKLVKNTSSTSSTFIGVVFTGSGLATASDLADSIGVCDLVSKWDVPAQGWVAYTPGLAFTDFALTAGDAYMVSVTSDTVFTQFGTLFRNKTFQLDTTSTTNSNAISVPMNRTDLTDLLLGCLPAIMGCSYTRVGFYRLCYQARHGADGFGYCTGELVLTLRTVGGNSTLFIYRKKHMFYLSASFDQ